jgi:hypothetical protein
VPVFTWECDEPCAGELAVSPVPPPRGAIAEIVLVGRHGRTGTAYASGLVSGQAYRATLSLTDLAGNVALVEPSATPFVPAQDATLPVITSPQLVYQSSDRVIVRWSTDEGSDSRARIFVNAADSGYELIEPAPTRNHQLELTRLEGFVQGPFEVRVRSCNPDGLCSGDTAIPAQLGPADVTAPSLSNVQVSAVTDGSAQVTWTTNEPSTSDLKLSPQGERVEGRTRVDSRKVNDHRVVLTRLPFNACFTLGVSSVDPAGNRATATQAPELCTERLVGSSSRWTVAAGTLLFALFGGLLLGWRPQRR